MRHKGNTQFGVFNFEAVLYFLRQYQNVVYHINRIRVNLEHEEQLVQVECTSLQLMRQSIELHAKGFFVIDYNTLLRVHCSTTKFRRLSNCTDTVSLSFPVVGRNHNIHDILHTICAEISI